MSLPLFLYPTTVVWVDDDASFIAHVPHLLEKMYTKTFIHPKACIGFFQDYQPFLQGINFRRGYKEVDSYEMSNHFPVDLNMPALQELHLQQSRYNEISVLVTDYDMPGMNGLDLCRRLQDQKMKKILLTGAAGHQQAVEAFNEGLIDCFIQKENPNVINETLFHIEKLSRAYLVMQGDALQGHLEIDRSLNLSDPVFIKFFKGWCSENKIKEHYLVDKLGTFLLIDEDGNKKYFVVHTERTLNNFTELYDDDVKSVVYVKGVQSREKIPYFGVGIDGWERSHEEWELCFYSPEVLIGKQTYYWAIAS